MNNCLECGSKILGRADKKFCNDECRNSFHNKQNKDSSNFMRVVNNKLRKNFRIIDGLIDSSNKAKTTKNHLLALGFDFTYFTHFKVYKNGAEYRFVYSVGYKMLDEDWILLVRN